MPVLGEGGREVWRRLELPRPREPRPLLRMMEVSEVIIIIVRMMEVSEVSAEAGVTC